MSSAAADMMAKSDMMASQILVILPVDSLAHMTT
jgi:hypothetical protein